MKYSGVEWIGEIPDKWELNKIGQLFNFRNEKVSDKDYAPLSVSKGGIVPQMETVAKSDASDDRKLVLVGDFAINSRSDRKMSCGVSPLDGSVSLINIILYPKNDNVIFNDYMNYLLKNYGFAEEFYRWGHGIVADLWTTKWQEMKSIMLPLPSVQKQKAIYDFLNQKTVEIDSLIEIESQQIEKLKEYKQAAIDNTISKVEDEIRIKFVCSLNGRIGFRGYKQEDLVAEGEGAITISPSNMQNLKMNYDKCHYLSWFKYEESPEIQLQNGDILFVKTGSTYGKSALVDNLPMEATINPQLLIFKNININNKYFLYALQTNDVKDQVEGFVIGGTIPTISQDKISKIRIKICDKEEQTRIVNYLDEQCDDIDKLIEIKQQKIEQLEEYKKSIIYEYVTGKKEVC